MVVSATPFSSENLFQAPSKWTPRHLQWLNIEEHHHLSASAIVEDANLPKKDDPLFETLANEFAKPTRHEVLTNLTHPGNRCEMIFSALDSALECFESGYPPQMELISIARGFMAHVDSKNALRFSYRSIPFQISSFNVKGTPRNDGAFFRITDRESSLPLTIFLAGKGPERLSTALPHEVVPYLLFQVPSILTI